MKTNPPNFRSNKKGREEMQFDAVAIDDVFQGGYFYVSATFSKFSPLLNLSLRRKESSTESARTTKLQNIFL